MKNNVHFQESGANLKYGIANERVLSKIADSDQIQCEVLDGKLL